MTRTLFKTIRGVAIPYFLSGVSLAGYGVNASAADNSAAVLEAITDVVAAGGGSIVVEPGTFNLNTAIKIPANVTLEGYGPTVSIFKIADSASGLFSVAKTDLTTNAENAHQAASTFPVKCFIYTATDAASSSTRTNGVQIRNIGIDGNGANQADSGSYANIFINNTNRARIDNVYSYNARPSLTVTGNQRAYCLLLSDDYQTFVTGGYYYGSGYDNIGLRGYSVGARFRDVVAGATSGANARASFQPAYQCTDWVCEGCWFENTNADGVLGTGVTVHSSQNGRFIACHIASTNAAALYLYGDITDASPDTNFDQLNAYPSATLDEYSDGCTFSACTIVASGIYATITGDGRWVRGHQFIGGCIRHTSAQSAVCVQLDGSQGSGPFASGERRIKFIGVRMEQFSASNVGNFTYCRGLTLDGCDFIKVDASNNALQFTSCVNVDLTGNRFHCASTSACNIGISITVTSSNPSDAFRISGNNFTKLNSNWNYGIYVTNATPSTNIKVVCNDFTNCATPIAFNAGTPGTGFWVEQNVGCLTEAVGTATVGGGGTVDITHGLTSWRTLRVGDLLITPTSATGVGTLYVSAVSSTIFTVTGTAAATFSWQARACAA